jgi:hypothetical protein
MMCVRFTEKYLEFARECIPTKTITIRDRDKRGLISKRGGIVQVRPTLPISFLTRDQNNLGSDEFSSRKSFELRKTVALHG